MVQNKNSEVKLVTVDPGDRGLELIREVLESGHLVQGEKVERFEQGVQNLLGQSPAAGGASAVNAAAVNSGTAALLLALEALGIGPGDTVLVPAFTFPSTANVVEKVGARVRFVDVDENTFNIDPEDLKDKCTDECRAVIPVHLFGVPADMDRVIAFAGGKGLSVIEDAACALGASLGGRMCGTIGDAGCFSFHPRKLVTTGEGGMVVSTRRELIDRIKSLRDHGFDVTSQGRDIRTPSLNYRLSDLHAAVGLASLEGSETEIMTRYSLAALYDDLLGRLEGVRLQGAPAGCLRVYQTYCVVLTGGKPRGEVIKGLRSQGVEATIGTYAVHSLLYYREKYDLKPDDFPVASRLGERTLALPMHSRMAESDVKRVVESLERTLSG